MISPYDDPVVSIFNERLGAQNFRGMRLHLAVNDEEMRQAQLLRYEVFCVEGDAFSGDDKCIDADAFDAYCHHLMVSDISSGEVVATYRILHEDHSHRKGGFYSASEYDLSALLHHRGLVEVGRSCVHKEYRTRWVMNLLWSGLVAYTKIMKASFLFGCASYHGLEAMPESFSYLYHHHLSPESLRVYAKEPFYAMNILSKEEVNEVQAWREMPPLIKGYVRAGCFVGSGAYIDKDFHSVDVFILLDIKRMSARYKERFFS